MRVSLGKTVKVNMGNYEAMELGGHVTLDEEDFDAGELKGMTRAERMAFMQAEAKRYLHDYLEPELRTAAEMSQATDSMLFDPEPAPRRTERTTRRRSTR